MCFGRLLRLHGRLRRPAIPSRLMGRVSWRLLPLGMLALLASCSTPTAEPSPSTPVPTPPPVSLDREIAEAASVYVAFARSMTETRPDFTSAEAVQAFLSKGAAYEPEQLSHGLIAYASILALQSPDYVSGIRAYAADSQQRRRIIVEIQSNPAYAATLPGADLAAGRIASVLSSDIAAFGALAEAIEADAYTIQERGDPRRRWAALPVIDRTGRLERTKAVSGTTLPASYEDAAQLFVAAYATIEPINGAQSAPPYSPAVNRALAVAALAALGGSDSEEHPQSRLLKHEKDSELCLTLSKLNLFQCLAASRPSYEDMFCIGRHVLRDLESCTRASVGEAPKPVIAALVPPRPFEEPGPSKQTSR